MIQNKTEQQQMMKDLENKTKEIKQITTTVNTLEITLYVNNLYADSLEYHYYLPCA